MGISIRMLWMLQIKIFIFSDTYTCTATNGIKNVTASANVKLVPGGATFDYGLGVWHNVHKGDKWDFELRSGRVRRIVCLFSAPVLNCAFQHFTD